MQFVEQPLAHREELNITVLDTESTGVNHDQHEVIAVAMLCLKVHAQTGRVLGTVASTVQRREPGSMDPDIEELVGVTRADLSGRAFDMAVVRDVVAASDLIVSHCAAFDRPFLEPLVPELVDKPWACSLSEIAWLADEGLAHASIDHLLSLHGRPPSDHTPEAVCRDLAFVLEQPLPRTPCTGFRRLIMAADELTLERAIAVGDGQAGRGLISSDTDLEKIGSRWCCTGEEEFSYIREFLRALMAQDPCLTELRVALCDARARFSAGRIHYFEP